VGQVLNKHQPLSTEALAQETKLFLPTLAEIGRITWELDNLAKCNKRMSHQASNR